MTKIKNVPALDKATTRPNENIKWIVKSLEKERLQKPTAFQGKAKSKIVIIIKQEGARYDGATQGGGLEGEEGGETVVRL